MIKLVLSDLDATLIWRDDHTITPFALSAIHTLMDAGVHFAPCTGRIMRELVRMFSGDKSACSTAVTSNGQLVYLDGDLIDSSPLPRSGLEAVRSAMHEIVDAYLVVEYDGEKTAIDVDRDYVLAHPDNFWRVRRTLDGLPAEPCFKANVRVVGTPERAREVASLLNDTVKGVDFVFPMPGTPHIDLTPTGLSKDHGGEVIMERLGLVLEEVVCFGDAENDLSMLRHFPHSVAVANAVPAVSDLARWHIGSAEEESVAHALLDIAEATTAGRMPAFMSR